MANNCLFFIKKIANGIFIKNDNFWPFICKKCEVFGHFLFLKNVKFYKFLTFKWKIFGGSVDIQWISSKELLFFAQFSYSKKLQRKECRCRSAVSNLLDFSDAIWPSGKLPFECQKIVFFFFFNFNFLMFDIKMTIFRRIRMG